MTGLDELSDAAVVDAETDDNALRPPPFAGVVARAYRLDPAAVTPTDVHAASTLPPGAPTPAAAGEGPTDEAWLRRFVVASQREAEADIVGRIQRGPPPLRVPSRFPWRWAVVGGAIAAAALVVLAVLRPGGLGLRRGSEQEPPSQAASSVERSADSGQAELRAPVRRRSPAPAPEPPVPEAEDEAEAETSDEPEVPPPAPEREPERSGLAERLQQLDAQAQQQLARGDLAGADRTLERLIRVGGRHRLVELAYGDRFTIAHRRRDSGRQVSLWRAYLRRFPGGRLADDARAGLCRHADADRRPSCWRDYLRDFPRGAYSSLARREASAVESDEG